jgi:uncharacterized membrane protein YcaP (DUF421 family)
MNQYIDIALRCIFSYFALLFLTRLMGRKQVSQLTFFDYVTGITIGSIAASISGDVSIKFWEGILAIAIWGGLTILTGYIDIKSIKARKIIDGEPVLLIKNGKIQGEKLRKSQLNMDDFLMLLREQQVFDITEVEFAIFETNGNLSVLKKSQYGTLSPKDMNLQTNYKGIMTDLIIDGNVIGKNLSEVKLNMEWLSSELAKQNIKNPKEVLFAGLQTDGQLYIATRSA